MKNTTDYWFTIEPYVYISIVNKYALLYNTLDRVIIESDKPEVILLLQEVLEEENCGVVLLKNERYKQKDIYNFIRDLRKKYMGDIIDVTLSEGKPVQVFPYINFFNKCGKKYDFYIPDNILNTLSEINIHIDRTTNIEKLILFLQAVRENLQFSIIGNIEENSESYELLSFFNRHPSPKKVLCSYTNVIPMDSIFNNNFSYRILVNFPIEMQKWDNSRQQLLNQTLSFEYVFDVTSLDDYQQVERLVEQYQIKKYHLNPVYTGNNISFFEENVFLTREDVLSTSISMKDLFSRQLININDFGKIHIMSNGDVYANVNHPVLGNINTHSIYEIVQKEVKDGISWLRIRNQAPCSTCIYQWLCPSPSDYEITIGRPNLCHVSNYNRK